MSKRWVSFISLIAVVMMTVSGCSWAKDAIDWSHLDGYFTNTKQVVIEIGKRNIDVITNYGRAGILSDYQVETYTKSIEDQTKAFIEGDR